MFSKKHPSLIAVLAMLALLFASCASTDKSAASSSAAKTAQAAEKGLFADWKGDWQSYSIVADAAELQAEYQGAVKDLPTYTAAGFQAAVETMFRTPFSKVSFDGSNKVAFTLKDESGKDTVLTCEYDAKGKVEAPGYEGKGIYWYTFEATKPVKGLAQAQYLILFPPESHGDGPKHWHGRFGGKSISALVNADDQLWWPTYINAATSRSQAIKELKAMVPSFKDMFPAESLAGYDQFGNNYVTVAALLDDPRPEFRQVYTTLIEKYAGQNPKGGNFTEKEIKEAIQASYGTADDFTHVKVNVENGKNEFIYLKNGKETARIEYQRDAPIKGKERNLAFTAVDKAKAGKFAYMCATLVHGMPAEPPHFHFYYGADAAAAGGMNFHPTGLPVSLNVKELADRVVSSGDYAIGKIIKK